MKRAVAFSKTTPKLQATLVCTAVLFVSGVMINAIKNFSIRGTTGAITLNKAAGELDSMQVVWWATYAWMDDRSKTRCSIREILSWLKIPT